MVSISRAPHGVSQATIVGGKARDPFGQLLTVASVCGF